MKSPLPMRAALVLLACSCGALAAERNETAPEKPTPQAMDELLRLYREFGLPLPPDNAPLVRTPTGWSQQLAPGKNVPIFTLGFLLKPAAGGKPAEILIGPLRTARELPREDGNPTPVNPAEVAIEKLSFDAPDSTFPLDTALATALQCHARGYASPRGGPLPARLPRAARGGPVAVSSGGPWVRHRQPIGLRGAAG